MANGTKIGKAQNEVGKSLFASDFLTENSAGLFWNDATVFTTDNFTTGSGLTGGATADNPLEWTGFSARNSSGTTLAANVKTLKAGTGAVFTVSDGILTLAVDISNYSASALTLTGGNTTLLLNGGWSLGGSNAVKLASDGTRTAYLFSNDPAHEYPALKVKSNAGGAERAFLLLDSGGKIPLENWTGFTAQNNSGAVLSPTVKTVMAGDNITFAAAGDILTIKADAAEITVDSVLSESSANPIQNKAVTAGLAEKITEPEGGITGQVLGRTKDGIAWVDQTGGDNEFITTAQLPAPEDADPAFTGHPLILTTASGADKGTVLLVQYDEANAAFTDQSNLHNTVVNTGVAYNGSGKFSGCGVFSSGTYLTFSGNDAFFFGASPFSVGIWFKTTSSNADGMLINQRESESHVGAWSLRTGNLYYHDGGHRNLYHDKTFNDGQWHFISFVRTGTQILLFFDGVLCKTGNVSLTQTFGFADMPLRSGYEQATGLGFSGELDETQIIAGSAKWISDFTPAGKALDASAKAAYGLGEVSIICRKDVLNQSMFTGTDSAYGGKYCELNGICEVAVTDANGFGVEFDIRYDFVNRTTRLYIPDSLAAGTISNWTLVYGAKQISA